MKTKGKSTYVLLVTGLSCAIAAGIGIASNISGLFLTPMAEELDISRAAVSSTVSLTNLIYALGGLFTGKLLKEKNLKKMILLSMIAVVSSTVFIALSSALWEVYLFQAAKGFFTGLLGTVYVTMIINRWFYEDTATVTSVVMGCSGISSALTSPLFSALIESRGWRFSLMMSAVVLAILYAVMYLCPLSLDPKTLGMEPHGVRADSEMNVSSQKKITFITAVLPVIYAGLGGLLLSIVQHLPSLAQTYSLSASIGASMLSMAMLTNTAGKIIAGKAIDKIGIGISSLLISASVAVGVLLVLFSRTPLILLIASALIGMSYSLSTVTAAMLVRQAVGVENYGKVYPSATMATTVVYALGATLTGYVYDRTSTYSPVLFTMLIELVLMIAVSSVVLKKADKDE